MGGNAECRCVAHTRCMGKHPQNFLPIPPFGRHSHFYHVVQYALPRPDSCRGRLFRLIKESP